MRFGPVERGPSGLGRDYQRPDLWGGAIIGSPLVDMKRYSHMLAGASWMGEYGNPDVPADWAFISQYSPYQNLKRGEHYPVPFIYTSTRDDRVHPGHARKLAARLEQYGDKFFYDEAIEGGHAAGIVPEEDAAESRARSGLSERGAAAAAGRHSADRARPLMLSVIARSVATKQSSFPSAGLLRFARNDAG